MTTQTSESETAPAVDLHRLVRRLRGLRSILSLMESGDAIVGATRSSLASRQQLRAAVDQVSAEITDMPDGSRHLLRATAACLKCDGRGHQPSYDLEPPKCPRCRGTGYRFSAPNDEDQRLPETARKQRGEGSDV